MQPDICSSVHYYAIHYHSVTIPTMPVIIQEGSCHISGLYPNPIEYPHRGAISAEHELITW